MLLPEMKFHAFAECAALEAPTPRHLLNPSWGGDHHWRPKKHSDNCPFKVAGGNWVIQAGQGVSSILLQGLKLQKDFWVLAPTWSAPRPAPKEPVAKYWDRMDFQGRGQGHGVQTRDDQVIRCGFQERIMVNHQMLSRNRFSATQGKEKLWAALILTCPSTGKSWRLCMTRSESSSCLQLLLTLAAAVKVMSKQRTDELKEDRSRRESGSSRPVVEEEKQTRRLSISALLTPGNTFSQVYSPNSSTLRTQM